MSPQNKPSHQTHSKRDIKGQIKALVADQRYDEIEQHLLETARLFFVAFSHPETQFWMHAYRYCEAAFPQEQGAAVAQSILHMLNVMRTTRPHTFNYTDPRCRACSKFLTPEERYLMQSFRQIRAGKMQLAHMNALLLCEGKDPARFLQATQELDQRFASFVH